jgi:hypothetical protein
MSSQLCQVMLKIDNRHGFNKQALSTVLICLAIGDEVDAAKRMDEFAMYSQPI